jgi:hypothetical protein
MYGFQTEWSKTTDPRTEGRQPAAQIKIHTQRQRRATTQQDLRCKKKKTKTDDIDPGQTTITQGSVTLLVQFLLYCCHSSQTRPGNTLKVLALYSYSFCASGRMSRKGRPSSSLMTERTQSSRSPCLGFGLWLGSGNQIIYFSVLWLVFCQLYLSCHLLFVYCLLSIFYCLLSTV